MDASICAVVGHMPGLTSLVVLGVSLFGDGLRDALDPPGADSHQRSVPRASVSFCGGEGQAEKNAHQDQPSKDNRKCQSYH